MLTDRQQQIWNYLVEYVDRHGYPPTVREIGERGRPRVALDRARAPGQPRARRAAAPRSDQAARARVDRPRASATRRPARGRRDAMRLPLIGEIAAGAPLLADQNIEEYMTVPGSTKGDFLLRVRASR